VISSAIISPRLFTKLAGIQKIRDAVIVGLHCYTVQRGASFF